MVKIKKKKRKNFAKKIGQKMEVDVKLNLKKELSVLNA